MKTISVKTKFGIAAIGLVALATLSPVVLYVTPLSYLYCLAREDVWLGSANEKELEGRLMAFYSKKSIAPTESMWGSNHVLKSDQRMIQYLIFGKEPLDAVYCKDGSIDAIYASYE